MIKLANKRNLSLRSRVLSSIALLSLLPAYTMMAQVPPRSEAAQEQREKKSPPDKDTIKWETSKIQPTLTIKAVSPCKLFFRGKTGKQGVINFCEEEVTYSGYIKADEAAKVFFEYLRDYMAACGENTEKKPRKFIRTCPPDPTGKSACAPGTQ